MCLVTTATGRRLASALFSQRHQGATPIIFLLFLSLLQEKQEKQEKQEEKQDKRLPRLTGIKKIPVNKGGDLGRSTLVVRPQ